MAQAPRRSGLESAALRQLDALLRQPDLAVQGQQPLAWWVSPQAADSLASAQLRTVFDLAQRYRQQGKNWWKDIAGLGRVSARRIEADLEQRCPGLLENPRPALALERTLAAPLAQAQQHRHGLDGAQGSNRAPAEPFIPMADDWAAVNAWLSLFDQDSHTCRSYRREAERLLLWAVMARKKPLSSLDAADLADYRRFLQDPQPAALWVGPPQRKGHPQWKPFSGPLSRRSAKHAETLLGGLFEFLVRQRYLQHNPLSALPKIKVAEELSPGIHRAFTPAQWRLIADSADRLVQDSDGRSRRKWLRTRLILHLGYATGLRLHELTQASVADLLTLTRHGQTQHWLSVLGKGRKRRQVPLPPALHRMLIHSYRELTGSEPGWQPPGYPLLPGLRQPARALTPMAVHKVIKDFFKRLAAQLAADDSDAAARMAGASTHWLRHSHGTLAADSNIPLTMIRDNMGHSSIAVTSRYLHSDADSRYDAFKQFGQPPAGAGRDEPH